MNGKRRTQWAVFCLALLGACQRHQTQAPLPVQPTLRAGAIDAARLANVGNEPGQWLTAGGDASGSYFSALTQINEGNIAGLGFAWEYKLGTRRGLEATPVVVDGTLFTSGNWGIVYALDAATGRELWTYDPAVDGQWGRYSCCDVVNRGVAVWQGRVYVVSLDGYLHALDARSGARLWKVDTLPAREPSGFHYTSTGAPVVAGDCIVIGTAGADFKGARGGVAAFDLSSGAFRWRFFTVPRDPKLGPQDQPHLAAALATWDPGYDWSTGGGATVWDGISYDPDLRLIYIGTGNGAPYAVGRDAPSGDQLYAASIVAIHAESGKLAWYRQEVPGDGWDYDATQKMVLTDLDFDGKQRRVLMQAAKNGFLYVLDRATGSVLAAHGFSPANWTLGLDPKTARPIRNPAADFARTPRLVAPGAQGAHSWQPMSYSRSTGLVYIPAMDAPMVYIDTRHRPAGLIEGSFDVAAIWPEQYEPKDLTSLFGALPSLRDVARVAHDKAPRSVGVLRAMEPKSGRIVWERAGSDMWDGGIMSTAGNLVFRGDIAGVMSVYSADNGKLLKTLDVGTTIMAAPMTYTVDGAQYVAVMAGWGGGNEYLPFPDGSAARKYGNSGRIVAFKLGGGEVPKPPALKATEWPQPPPREGSSAGIAKGEILYNRFCARCHVFGQGMLPDLRRMSPATHSLFYDIVLNGAFQGKGMARWDDVLSRADAEDIHAYLIAQAWLKIDH